MKRRDAEWKNGHLSPVRPGDWDWQCVGNFWSRGIEISMAGFERRAPEIEAQQSPNQKQATFGKLISFSDSSRICGNCFLHKYIIVRISVDF